MEMDWPYTQKNRRSSGGTSTTLEPVGSQTERTSRITWKRSIEEEIRGENKTWREVKAIATQRER